MTSLLKTVIGDGRSMNASPSSTTAPDAVETNVSSSDETLKAKQLHYLSPAETSGSRSVPSIFSNLRGLINVIDDLRDVGVHHFVDLPRICVVGTQSAGKSSVLESIVGITFLPRGGGIVTRRPLELRLIHLSPQQVDPETEAQFKCHGSLGWAIFEADSTKKKYYDFEEVCREIERVTDEVAGKNKGIVDDPIVLTVCGLTCPDLTLVDLPGITRVPMKGSDQTDEIEKVTREMAFRYANDPRTVILAVIPANQDISTSDALQLARRVDPKGLRTIGVITKIDLMDRGTNASRMVTGEEIPLRLGYVAVRNRSQEDIVSRKNLQTAIEEERNFFRSHPIYRTLPQNLFGSQSLVDKLTKVLFRHIRKFLPEIKAEINGKLSSVRDRLGELGDGVPVEPAERNQLMWTLINDYCELFKNTIRGKFDRKLSIYFDNQNIASGSQIRTIFNELLEDFVLAGSVTKNMTDTEIDNAMRVHEGDSLPGFPSPDTFESLILPHLRKISDPVLNCLDQVSQTLEVLTQKIGNRVFNRFPLLAQEVLGLSQNVLQREKEHTRQILEYIVTAETSYLFTNDQTYLTEHASIIPAGASLANGDSPEKQANAPSMRSSYLPWSGILSKEAVPDVLEDPGRQQTSSGTLPGSNQSNNTPGPVAPTGAGGAMSSLYTSVTGPMQNLWAQTTGAGQQEGIRARKTRYSQALLQEIRKRLDAYFAIVLRNIRDTVPKAIGSFLVRTVPEMLQYELYNQLHRSEQIGILLGEPPEVREERKLLTARVETFSKALHILQRDPSITTLIGDEDIDDLYDWDLEVARSTVSKNAEGLNIWAAASEETQPRKTGLMSRSAATGNDGGDAAKTINGVAAPPTNLSSKHVSDSLMSHFMDIKNESAGSRPSLFGKSKTGAADARKMAAGVTPLFTKESR